MTAAQTPPAAHGVRPRERAPGLIVPLHGDGTFTLGDHAPESFTMVVFFRGLHCPVCRAQLTELDGRLGDFTERGIEVVAVSGESQERTGRLVKEWGLEHLRVAFGLTEERMRAWGLFVSRGMKEDEPQQFNEPALFLIAPDGTVYYEAILSMPVGRPPLDDLLHGLDAWAEMGYPARGEA